MRASVSAQGTESDEIEFDEDTDADTRIERERWQQNHLVPWGRHDQSPTGGSGAYFLLSLSLSLFVPPT